MTDQELRQRLVERLERTRVLTDGRVASAVLHVPRHRFIPQIARSEAYEDRAIAIKERDGEVISSISQPSMIVQMLQLLGVEPGQTVLEIGTGSGYNAALLGHITGPTGNVVSVDIESDLIAAARERFDELQIANVRVVEAAALAPLTQMFDRVIVTARADDIETDWWRLLREGGRIVVPLDIGYGGERAFGFVRRRSLLHSVGSYACAFIGMREEAAAHGPGPVFFPNRDARYENPRDQRTQLSIVATPRSEATASLTDGADVIVARPVTIFAIRMG